MGTESDGVGGGGVWLAVGEGDEIGSGVAAAVSVRCCESTVGELAGAWPPRSPASEEPHALSNSPRQQIAITCVASAAALDADMRGLYRWDSSRLFAAKDTDARGNRSIRVASMDGGDRMSQPSVLWVQQPCQEESVLWIVIPAWS